MSDEDVRREEEEAARLESQISRLRSQIFSLAGENDRLEMELGRVLVDVEALVRQCERMDQAVYERMGFLSGLVEQADISTTELYDALNELTTQYFIYKNIATASKNMTQFTDEYHRKFYYYNELRRISLGYVIGLDTYIISSETMRKRVEKAYLQNTEYWLAYCIMAVMLWASNEREAAERALSKSISIHDNHACLFYLLINLRFNRIDAAKKWYINYMDRVDVSNLGEEWQYLLQAYLMGAFGGDPDFEKQIGARFQEMLEQSKATTAAFGKDFCSRATAFASLYLHQTACQFINLKEICSDYEALLQLLTKAEKNGVIAKYYRNLAEKAVEEGDDLAHRIENVLYALINDYDEDELEVVKKIKYNQAIIDAHGDVAAAQENYDSVFSQPGQKRTIHDLLLFWAFADDAGQVGTTVKRFAISFMKEWIAKGFQEYQNTYREEEQPEYSFEIDQCRLVCGELAYEAVSPQLEKYYDKRKLKETLQDKSVRICLALCAASLLTLLVMTRYFSKIALTIAIIAGLAGTFLLWRRTVDLGKLLKEKKQKGLLKLKHALDELKQWRSLYQEEDAKAALLLDVIEKF